MMDVTQALKDAENTLRDFIASVLSQNLGQDWVDKCGVTSDRVTKWRERKETEAKQQEAGVVDERLIYYADFYDLKTILKKNWSGPFSEALGDLKTFEIWLDELEKLRDPEAHRRELLPHQKHLAIGISGEIRGRIIRFRSRRETTDDCFPRIESARDSLGNIWVPLGGPGDTHTVSTRMALRPGDSVEFVVTASDPEGLPLQYGIIANSGEVLWQESGVFSVTFSEKDIGVFAFVQLSIKSPRSYHARRSDDDSVMFSYQILPTKKQASALEEK
jgi:hypothetical protein